MSTMGIKDAHALLESLGIAAPITNSNFVVEVAGKIRDLQQQLNVQATALDAKVTALSLKEGDVLVINSDDIDERLVSGIKASAEKVNAKNGIGKVAALLAFPNEDSIHVAFNVKDLRDGDMIVVRSAGMTDAEMEELKGVLARSGCSEQVALVLLSGFEDTIQKVGGADQAKGPPMAGTAAK